MVKTYIKKPGTIEALHWTGVNLNELIEFVGDSLTYNICDTAWEVGKGRPYVIAKIKTAEGEKFICDGDYIIKELNGEFHACNSDIFEATYELYDSYCCRHYED